MYDNIIQVKPMFIITLKTTIAIYLLFHFDPLGLGVLLAVLKPTNENNSSQQLLYHGLHETANSCSVHTWELTHLFHFFS